jgi:hypothetical protein
MGEDRTGIALPFIVPETEMVSFFFVGIRVEVGSWKQDYDENKISI